MTSRTRASAIAFALASTLASTVLTVGGPTAVAAPSPRAAGGDAVLDWYDASAGAVRTFASPVQAPSSALWATAWLAADRAVAAPAPGSGPYAEVAAAQALHDVLAAKVPAEATRLDAELAETVAGAPAGPRRAAALQRGREAAADTLADRAGDGLDVASVNRSWVPTRAGAGYWVTTATGKPAIQAGLVDARPFLLGEGDRFRVPAPPAVGTDAYRTELAEVAAYGAKGSVVRTPEQTQVALFWGQSSLNAYTQVLRAAVAQLADEGASVRERVHLVSVFHRVTTDATIGVYEAKYVYERWRPLTAIREADASGAPIPDGDPLTTPDPSWEPLITTPVHPEYPSGHAGYAGAAAAVLDALVGEARPFTITSTVSGAAPRTYDDWDALVGENVDARVWEGVHFRSSDVAAARLGRAVADYDLGR